MSGFEAPFAFRSGWLPASAADGLLAALTDGLAWEQPEITMFGRRTPVPRLTCWVGEADYSYSGIRNHGRPWTPELAALRDRLTAEAGVGFNSVLANLYRTGEDSMGWHADDEPELGTEPVIASVNLGATRDFVVRHEATGAKQTFPLGHGDLLVMSGESQRYYRHAVPKRKRVTGPRINLTFRRIG